MTEDQFTSIRWDRDDKDSEQQNPAQSQPHEDFHKTPEHHSPDPIQEEAEDGPELPLETSSLALGSSQQSHEHEDVAPKQDDVPEASEAPEAPQAEEPQNAEATMEQNQLKQKEQSENFDNYTIDVKVSHPISDKDGNAKLFISYLITTVSNHPLVTSLASNKETDSSSVVVKVRRRYGDFRFLHDCLVNDFPECLVPPLPAKLNIKYLTGDTFSTSFVHKRLHSLDRFIKYICLHRYLLQLSVFHYFISDSAEWGTFTKNLKVFKNGAASAEEGEFNGLGVMGKVVNEDLLTETVMNFFTSSKHKRETNKDILVILDKLKKLYENLVKLDKIFSKLNKKNSDLRLDYEQFSNQINKLAQVHSNTVLANESSLVDPNKLIQTTAETGMYVNDFKVFLDSLLYFLEHWATLHHYIDESFLVALKDCAKYIVRFTDLIELQHNKKIDLQVLQDYLSKARGDLAAIGGAPTSQQKPVILGQPGATSGGLVNNTTQLIKDTILTSATPNIGSLHADHKRTKLESRITQLEAEIKAQTQLVNHLTSRIINEEYPNWDAFNKAQLKLSMVELCDEQISFYKDLVDNWTGVEEKLSRRLAEL